MLRVLTDTVINMKHIYFPVPLGEQGDWHESVIEAVAHFK